MDPLAAWAALLHCCAPVFNRRSFAVFGDLVAVDSIDLVEGTYKLDVAVHKFDGFPYDYHRLLYTFRIKSRTKDVGIYRPKHVWRFSDGVSVDTTPGPHASE